VADIRCLVRVDAMVRHALRKASFGGDRSAAGRYAAEQRWKGHVVQSDKPSGRSTDAKLAEGPSNLLYGRDEFGMPKMGSLPELKKRYGSSADKRSQYFRLVYGLRVAVQPVKAGSPEEATQLGGLQALEELCMSIEDVPSLVKKVSLTPQVERYNGIATGVHGQYSSGYVDLATKETAKYATDTVKNIAAIQRIMLERGVVGEAEAATSGVLASRRDAVSDIFASAEAARTKPSSSPETSPTDIKRASQRAGYAVMVHEFGHAIDFGEGAEQSRDTALSTRQADRLAELESPSRYGMMNQYEKVAESWASWWLFGGASEGNSPAWATRIRGQAVQILGPILEERQDVVKSEELSLRLLDLPVTHPVTLFTVAPFISSAALIKASFGGDRSAAGRYAAEQRWKNHQKKERAGGNATTPPTATPAVRTTEEKLANGPQNLIFGLDQYGMPKMGTLDELKKRYGRGADARSKYFMDKHGVKVKIVPVQAESIEETTQLGALQAIEEVLMNTENHDRLVKNISLGDDGTATYKKFDANGYFQDGYITLKQESIMERLRKIIPNWMSNAVDITQNLSFRFAQQGVPAQQDNVFGILRTMCQRAGYAVMVHEFGHAMDMGGEASEGRRSDASSSRHYQEIFDRGGAGLPKSVSGYGNRNEFEFVAEAWTAWFLFGRSSIATGFSGDSYGELAAPILRPIFDDRKDVVKAVERSIDIADLPLGHPVVMFILAPFISSATLIKASFGGDRSAAGRYAANIRWQGAGAAKNEAWIRSFKRLHEQIMKPKNTDSSLNTRPVRHDAADISQELKTYFGETEDAYLVSQGYQDIQKKVADDSRYKEDVGDTMLEIIAEKQGFTGAPRVVSAEEMAQLEKDGWTIAYRGIADQYTRTASFDEKPVKLASGEDLAEQFRTGQYFAGFGNVGNGIFFVEQELVAHAYAGNAYMVSTGVLGMGTTKNGAVLKIAVPPGVLMSESEFREEIRKHRDERGEGDFFGSDDLGRKLAARGIRGVKITIGVGGGVDGKIVLIWDRSMVAVQEAETQT